MRIKGSAAVLEERRHRALRLVQEGHSFNEVGRRLACAASSVMRWHRAWRKQGLAGLKVRKAPGRPSRLSTRQCRRLLGWLKQGAQTHGFYTDLWTTHRISVFIQRRFRVKYHRSHVSRLLGRLAWSCQKPELRPRQQDPAAVQQWLDQAVPRIKKKPAV